MNRILPLVALFLAGISVALAVTVLILIAIGGSDR